MNGGLFTATAVAHPNLAFVKYWGQRDPELNIPINGSISVNLSGARTITRVSFDPDLTADAVSVDGSPAAPQALARIVRHLDRVRGLAGITTCARVESYSDFPSAVGIAASASGFAALTLAASRAAGLALDLRALSVLARKGSGSACRSIPGGFVEWVAGHDDATSYAFTIAPSDAWDLRVISVAVSRESKPISSLRGHRAAFTSPFIAARLESVAQTLGLVRVAIKRRDLELLGMTVEREALSLHAVAMTSRVIDAPWLSGIYYMQPDTLRLIQAVQAWRSDGLGVYFSLDAGPTVHLVCEARSVAQVMAALDEVPGNDTYLRILSSPGRGVWLVDEAAGGDAPTA